jgi:hypothetical protein
MAADTKGGFMKAQRRPLAALGLALAVAAVVAPAVQAKPTSANIRIRQYADDLHSRSMVSIERRRFVRPPTPARPALGPPRNYGLTNTRSRPGLYQPVDRVVSDDSSGFDWADAGIGAGSALGLMLLGGGALLAARHNRRGRLAAL